MEGEQLFDCCFEQERTVEEIEHSIMNDGVTFIVNYIGCVEIVTSMKLLDFQSRSAVAKECINRVCDAANIKSPKKRRVEKRIQQCVSTDDPCMEHCKAQVILNISSRCLELTSTETGDVVARHDMPNISFASGGDSDSMNFVAYVAKDVMGWRACYVLECGLDKAQTVISTMGQAFELRYKNFCGDDVNRRKQSPISSSRIVKCDQDYYNDLPGKMPPEFSDSSSERRRERLHSNLIDLNTSIEHDDCGNADSDGNLSSVNYNTAGSSMGARDVFDMQCFSLSPEVQLQQLLLENWFHGTISRAMSENLLKNDGDFLVRESQASGGQGHLPRQYVLTGLNQGCPRHLLLIDPEGVVRTKDRVFENISHLINYHWSNRLPIISAESSLLLRTPVIRTTACLKSEPSRFH